MFSAKIVYYAVVISSRRDSPLKPPIVNFSDFSFDKVVEDKEGIYEVNPHRHELALLDGILHYDDEKAVGYYDVPEDAFWIRGHFPGRPLMPGVLITEVAAQLTSYLGTRNGIRGDAVIGLAGVTDVRFRAQVMPGDRLVVMVKTLKSRNCLLYTSPSPRDGLLSRMPSSA